MSQISLFSTPEVFKLQSDYTKNCEVQRLINTSHSQWNNVQLAIKTIQFFLNNLCFMSFEWGLIVREVWRKGMMIGLMIWSITPLLHYPLSDQHIKRSLLNNHKHNALFLLCAKMLFWACRFFELSSSAVMMGIVVMSLTPAFSNNSFGVSLPLRVRGVG